MSIEQTIQNLINKSKKEISKTEINNQEIFNLTKIYHTLELTKEKILEIESTIKLLGAVITSIINKKTTQEAALYTLQVVETNLNDNSRIFED